MSFKYRLILIILSILTFVIAAPVIILYGQGYRYDFRYHRLTKTGSLLINSVPANALVIIDGQIQKPRWYHQLLFYKKFFGLTRIQSTTPTVISNFLPGKYQIVVKKQNYYLWQKKIEIQAEKTTNIGKIYLFLERPNLQLLIEDDIDFLYPLINGKEIIYSIYNPTQQISEIKLISLDNPSKKIFLTKMNGRISKIREFPNYILIRSAGSKFLIINLQNYQIINPNNWIKNLQKIEYYDKLFYAQSNNIIYSFNPEKKQIEPIFNLKFYYQDASSNYKNSSLIDWIIKDGYLYLLIKNQDKISLDKHHLENSPEKYKLKFTSYSLDLPIYQFQFSSDQINNLVFLQTDYDIFVIDSNQKMNPIIFKNRAKDIIFRPDISKILYFNDFEIFLAEAIKDSEGKIKIKDELINRRSQLINQVIWHPSNTYLITADKNNILAIEIDGRDVRNIYKLLEAEEIKNIWFANDPRDLYLLGKINSQKGVWRIRIQ